MAATLAELKIYDLKETIDQEDLSVTIKDKAKLSPPSANAVACTILQLHSASDAQAPLRLFVPHRLLLIAPPPQTAQSSSLPDQTTQNYLYSLAKDAEEAAVSQSCSSILAGLGSESDDFGDVAVWLGQGEYGRGHEADALKRLGFEQWATHGQISVLPPSSVLANFKQPTPQLAKLAEDIAWLTDAHFFRLQVPGMSGGVVVFFYLGQLAAHGKPAGWGGLRHVLAIGFDPNLLVRDAVGVVDIIVRSSRSVTGAGSKALDPSGGNSVYASDDRGQQLYVTSCPVCDLVYNDIGALKADTITVTVSFQSPDIHMPVSPQMPPAAARFTRSVYDTILIGTELNDVEFILPSRKKLDRVMAYKAVYGNREVLRGILTYLDTLLFDDNFTEASLRADMEEESEEESVEQGAKDAPLPDESHQEGQDNAQASPKVSGSPATPFDAFGDIEQPRRDVNAERRKGRVLHIDGFAYHTWRALVFYLYTGKITFRDLKSSDPLLPSHSDGCSPKSMYRVAHMLEMPDLQALCLKNLESQLTAENIVQEVFSVFTSRYTDVRKMGISSLKKYYKECAPERTAILARVVKGEFPHCMDVVEAMMNFVR
ncbi:hypothetical protein EV121DRAFT_294482 [Schizophyllum commune]